MSKWTDDPLAIAELLRDGQVERERLHALLLAIMRALPHGHEAPMDQWPQMIADQATALAERDATIARLREAIALAASEVQHIADAGVPRPPGGQQVGPGIYQMTLSTGRAITRILMRLTDAKDATPLPALTPAKEADRG